MPPALHANAPTAPISLMNRPSSALAAGAAGVTELRPMDAFVAPELHAPDAALQRLEQRIAQAAPARPVALLAELAWCLRESDTTRAAELAAEVLARLAIDGGGTEHPSWYPRMRLVQAEADWNFGRTDLAAGHFAAATAAFAERDDWLGLSDAALFQVMVQNLKGDSEARDAAALQAIAYAREAGDEARWLLCNARAAFFRCFSRLTEAEETWGEMMTGLLDHESPMLRAAANEFLATVHHFRNRPAQSVKHRLEGYGEALQCGMLRTALRCTSNLACDLDNMQAAEEALDWAERGLEMARRSGWTYAISVALFRAGAVLLGMKQPQRALLLLEEASVSLASIPSSHSFALVMQSLGEARLALGQVAEAHEHFEALRVHPMVVESPLLTGLVGKGMAQALLGMGQREAAFEAAREALVVARQPDARVILIETLMTLAQICRGISPAGDGDGSGAAQDRSELYWLEQALQETRATEGMQADPELLGALAQLHANRGEMAAAYGFAVEQLAAERALNTSRVTNRSLVLEISHRTEQTRREAAHSRRLMEEQTQRAEVQAQTSSLLESLGRMGREITAQRDTASVLTTLLRHVGQLLSPQSMWVYLVDEERRRLRSGYGIEDGVPLPDRVIDIDHPTSWTARCAREACELAFDAHSAERPTVMPGTLPMSSGMFLPLMAGSELLGVMSLQSLQAGAFGEREQLVVRTLTAYGAIAVDNARAYGQLEAALLRLHDAEAQLIQRNEELHQANLVLSELSSTDALTGLRNRRYVEQQLDADVALCLRAYTAWLEAGAAPAEVPWKHDLGFFMIDLDHFKSINDTHGHAAGDRVLAEVRQRLLQVFRESDYLVRWGGEEFLVVARGLQRDSAPQLAERVRRAVAEQPFQVSATLAIDCTCSIGVACFPPAPHDPAATHWQQVVSRADDALYRAKAAGRNRWKLTTAEADGDPR